MTLKIVAPKGLIPKALLDGLDSFEMAEVSAELAEETIALILDGFADHSDPYGDEWAELKIRDGNPLEDTGGLRNSWARGEVTAEVAEVVNGKDYADFHQGGTGVHGPKGVRIQPISGLALKIPGVGFRASSAGTVARKMIPDGEPPDKWTERYDEAIREYFEVIFK